MFFVPLIMGAFVGADVATEGESTQKIKDKVESAYEQVVDTVTPTRTDKIEVIDLSTERK